MTGEQIKPETEVFIAELSKIVSEVRPDIIFDDTENFIHAILDLASDDWLDIQNSLQETCRTTAEAWLKTSVSYADDNAPRYAKRITMLLENGIMPTVNFVKLAKLFDIRTRGADKVCNLMQNFMYSIHGKEVTDEQKKPYFELLQRYNELEEEVEKIKEELIVELTNILEKIKQEREAS